MNDTSSHITSLLPGHPTLLRHPERSEGSGTVFAEILRCAQDDQRGAQDGGRGARLTSATRPPLPCYPRRPARALRPPPFLLLLALLLALLPGTARAQERVLDDFEDLGRWQAVAADGVKIELHPAEGRTGQALRIDFDFQGGGGYAIARAPLDLTFPENYQFSFYVRAEAPVNTLEFKLVDPSGENVWWVNRRNFDFPRDWTKVTFKKRHLSFAWGPVGGGDIEAAAAVEFVVTASTGGKGSVYVDDFTFTPLAPVTPYDQTPTARASGRDAAALLDGDPATAWRSDGDGAQPIDLDFLQSREYGGLVLDWDADDYATAYDVQIGQDGARWETVATVTRGDGGRDYVYLPETEGRHLRLHLRASSRGQGYALREVAVQPLDFAASPEAFFRAVAADAPPGFYPRYFNDEQAYWTVVGVPGNVQEGLMDTDGRLEVGNNQFSVEPFLYTGGELVTWHDADRGVWLEDGYLPIPTVEWRKDSLGLQVTAWALGNPDASVLYARYRVTNHGDAPQQGTLYLALRPFQVNPPWQFLNTPGGIARIRTLERIDEGVLVNGTTRIVTRYAPPDGFGAVAFETGNIVDFLARGELPATEAASDPLGFASGAFAYAYDLPAGDHHDVLIAVPLQEAAEPARATFQVSDTLLESAETLWRERLDRVEIDVPEAGERIVRAMKSNVAYILINQDGPAIQPGSRSYERSWIRDGALTSTALLQMGHAGTVRQFITWYAPFQYDTGRIPCCVDLQLGAGAVPEHDSDGEFIYLVAEYYRYTGDEALVRAVWPHVVRAVDHLDALRHERLTPAYQTPETDVFYGLLPPSISHEGYSAKPMHSYWDDLFGLKGFKDAVFLAEVLGEEAEAARFAAMRDEFRDHLYASMRRALEVHAIDYLPGAADLGDFDATSTTIALDPVGERTHLPEPAFTRTFETYWENFVARRDGATAWDAYTPYEWRVVGTFIRLGWTARAHEAIDFFFEDSRPGAWNHWAEVVWRDRSTPKFIGDMPHTWVGSDFIRSMRNLFVYERDDDEALVLGAGIPEAWARDPDGIRVAGLPTYYGPLTYTLRPDGEALVAQVEGVRVPPGGLVVHAPGDRPLRRVTVNGETIPASASGEVLLHTLPATVVMEY